MSDLIFYGDQSNAASNVSQMCEDDGKLVKTLILPSILTIPFSVFGHP